MYTNWVVSNVLNVGCVKSEKYYVRVYYILGESRYSISILGHIKLKNINQDIACYVSLHDIDHSHSPSNEQKKNEYCNTHTQSNDGC